jgi:hypothetical protein
MSLFGRTKGRVEKAARYIGSTGKGALRKLGDTVKTVRKMAGDVDKATGGLAGKAFEASKSLPGIGAITRNVEKGLDLAEKVSSKGLRAIDAGERGVKAFKGSYG